MGYDIHITRQNNWFGENNSQRISIDEWKDLLARDAEMRLDNFAEAPTTLGDTLRLECEGIAIWNKYSRDEPNGNHAWFAYCSGNIVVKNPDNEIIGKMLDIAELLNAKVQGDDGEIYERNVENQIINNQKVDMRNAGNKPKSWWKLW